MSDSPLGDWEIWCLLVNDIKIREVPSESENYDTYGVASLSANNGKIGYASLRPLKGPKEIRDAYCELKTKKGGRDTFANELQCAFSCIDKIISEGLNKRTKAEWEAAHKKLIQKI